MILLYYYVLQLQPIPICINGGFLCCQVFCMLDFINSLSSRMHGAWSDDFWFFLFWFWYCRAGQRTRRAPKPKTEFLVLVLGGIVRTSHINNFLHIQPSGHRFICIYKKYSPCCCKQFSEHILSDERSKSQIQIDCRQHFQQFNIFLLTLSSYEITN